MADLDTLVSQFQNKNEVAFQKLYGMYSDSIHGVVYNIVKDTAIADELMQDVFIKAWHNAHTYSSKKGRFFTWILNIARNAAIDKTRSKAFKQKKQNLNSDFFVDIITSNDNLDNSTDAIGIKKFVKNLGKKCKEVIELLYFKGFTQKETSEELDMPIGTVKTRNRNCIKELRDMVL
ncbi:sigma-70 family RNA polymerase sigma factor [Winogradskyella sp. SYSU M77433]|uniref:RNA polymerase sigma factor n=1 Tax=Winogradskyella sp. SYSU M77433 TaxID=3042722 RepID=UPI00247FA41E|nr:sigma-70 family RNA polymerase sigma factor [Winogradskyella sp. SYSU M77433]MDH7914107.1 sigma-70 family RNA polymerase sigma factor [Winogradskyella sp. SYSU M77433]